MDGDFEDRTQSGRRSSQDAAEPAGGKIRPGTANAKAAVTQWFLSHVVQASAVNERTGSFYKPQRRVPSSSLSCGEEGGKHCGHRRVSCLCRADPRWGRGPGSPRPLPVGPAAGKLLCCGGCRAGTSGGRRARPPRSPPACRWSRCWQCSRCSWLWPLVGHRKGTRNKGMWRVLPDSRCKPMHCSQRPPKLLSSCVSYKAQGSSAPGLTMTVFTMHSCQSVVKKPEKGEVIKQAVLSFCN